MKSGELNTSSPVRNRLRIGAVAVGLLIPASTAAAETSIQHHEPTSAVPITSEALSAALTKEADQISRDIAEKRPITFANVDVYFPQDGDSGFGIVNPIESVIDVNGHSEHIYGLIERKGGPTGIDVEVFLPSEPPQIYPNYGDAENMPLESRVIFPDPKGASYDPTNPVNPETGKPYFNQQGDPLEIGLVYFGEK